MYFEFATSNRIVFGPGSMQTVESAASDLGRRAMVVTGRSSQRAEPLMRLLDKKNMATNHIKVEEEPTVAVLENGLSLARENKTDFVIGYGGGSAIDTAKAIAALMRQSGPVLDFLEVIGDGKPLAHRPIPMIAIPTTAGTGSTIVASVGSHSSPIAADHSASERISHQVSPAPSSGARSGQLETSASIPWTHCVSSARSMKM